MAKLDTNCSLYYQVSIPHLSVRAIHASLFYLRVHAPVCPEHPALQRVDGNTTGLIDTVVDQCLPHVAIEVCDLYRQGMCYRMMLLQ